MIALSSSLIDRLYAHWHPEPELPSVVVEAIEFIRTHARHPSAPAPNDNAARAHARIAFKDHTGRWDTVGTNAVIDAYLAFARPSAPDTGTVTTQATFCAIRLRDEAPQSPWNEGAESAAPDTGPLVKKLEALKTKNTLTNLALTGGEEWILNEAIAIVRDFEKGAAGEQIIQNATFRKGVNEQIIQNADQGCVQSLDTLPSPTPYTDGTTSREYDEQGRPMTHWGGMKAGAPAKQPMDVVERVADSIELAFTTLSKFPATVLCRDEVDYKTIARLAIDTMETNRCEITDNADVQSIEKDIADALALKVTVDGVACGPPTPTMQAKVVMAIVRPFLRTQSTSTSAAIKQRDALWMLLDDIDTLSDMAKTDYEGFAKHCYAIQQRRHAILHSDDLTPPITGGNHD